MRKVDPWRSSTRLACVVRKQRREIERKGRQEHSLVLSCFKTFDYRARRFVMIARKCCPTEH